MPDCQRHPRLSLWQRPQTGRIPLHLDFFFLLQEQLVQESNKRHEQDVTNCYKPEVSAAHLHCL